MSAPLRTNQQRFIEKKEAVNVDRCDLDDQLEIVLEQMFASIRKTLRFSERVDHFSHPTIDGWVASGFTHDPGDHRRYTIELAFGSSINPYTANSVLVASAIVSGPND